MFHHSLTCWFLLMFSDSLIVFFYNAKHARELNFQGQRKSQKYFTPRLYKC